MYRGQPHDLGPAAKRALYSDETMPDSTSRPRLLVVETDDSVRRVLGRALSARFEVAPIAKGALGRLQEERFDALLLDLGVGEPAFDLLKAARKSAPSLPIVVTGSEEHRAEALALGARAFVAKPYDAAALDAALSFTRV